MPVYTLVFLQQISCYGPKRAKTYFHRFLLSRLLSIKATQIPATLMFYSVQYKANISPLATVFTYTDSGVAYSLAKSELTA